MNAKGCIGLCCRFLSYDMLFILLSCEDELGIVYTGILTALMIIFQVLGLWILHKAEEDYESLETKVELLFDQHWIEDKNGFHRRDVCEGKEHKEDQNYE